MISLSYPVPLPPPRLLARIEQSGDSANWCRFLLNPWHQMCQIHPTATDSDLSEKYLQLLIKSVIFWWPPTGWILTIKDLGSAQTWVSGSVCLPLKQFIEAAQVGGRLLYWLARSTGKDGHKPHGQQARSHGCTVVMEGFYSGPGDIFHAWPTHAAVVKTRRLERKTAHEKSQTLVFYMACNKFGCALYCCNITKRRYI